MSKQKLVTHSAQLIIMVVWAATVFLSPAYAAPSELTVELVTEPQPGVAGDWIVTEEEWFATQNQPTQYCLDSPGNPTPVSGWETLSMKAGQIVEEVRQYNIPYWLYAANATPQCTLKIRENRSWSRRRLISCPSPLGAAEYEQDDPEFGRTDLLCSNSDSVKVFGEPPTESECAKNGNPCDAATGDKSQIETDIDHASVPFVRYYHSYMQFGSTTHLKATESIGNYPKKIFTNTANIGAGWSHTYSSSLIVNAGVPKAAHRFDGYVEVLKLQSGAYVSTRGNGLQVRPDGSDWVLYLPSGGQERYNAAGKLLSIKDVSGRITTLIYDTDKPLLLKQVIGPFGHLLTIGYDANDVRIASVTDPSGGVVYYQYANGNLETVTYQDMTSKTYLYTEAGFPHHLTGIVDEDGEPFASYDYDTNGRVTDSEHAGYSVVHQEFLNCLPQAGTVVTMGVGVDAVTKHYTFTKCIQLPWRYSSTTYASMQAAIAAARTAEQNPYLVAVGISQAVPGAIADEYPKPASIEIDGESTVFTPTPGDYARRPQSISRNGTTKNFTYNIFHQASQTEDVGGFNRVTSTSYLEDTSALPTVVETPSVAEGTNKKTVTTQYHPGTRLVWKITEAGYRTNGTAVTPRVTEFVTYNAYGQVTQINGPRTDVNDTVNMTYWEEITPGTPCVTNAPGGKCGQIKTISNALNHVTTFNDYYSDGRLQQMTDPQGLVTNFEYTERGLIEHITETPPTGTPRWVHYTYTDAGLLDIVTYSSGHSVDYGWDAAHQLRSVLPADGTEAVLNYDTRDNLKSVEYRDSLSTTRLVSMAYDALNRIKQLEEGSSGNGADYVTDSAGNLRFITEDYGPAASALQRQTATVYDNLNRPETSVDPQSLTTTFVHDIQDNLTSIGVPKSSSENVTTDYEYDDLGNLLKEVSPDRGTTLYGYDAAGNMTCKADGRYTGSYTTCESVPERSVHSYDALNRLTAISFPADPSLDMIYDWDWFGAGELTQLGRANRNDYEWRDYNAWGQLTGQWDYIDNGSGGVESLQTYYGYDSNHFLQTITYPKPLPSQSQVLQVTHARDNQGRIVGITATFNGQPYTVINGTAANPGVFYKPFGPVTKINFGNGVTQDWLYDDAYGIDRVKVTNSSSTSLLDWDYTLDAAGNVASINKNGSITHYSYNIVDRLTQDGSATFSYDGNGNINATGLNLTYVNGSNQLATRGGAAVSHDGMGNVTADSGIVSFAYDGAGRLSTMSRTPSGQPTQTFTNQYNGKGERSFTHRVLSPTERYVEYYTYTEDGRLLTFVQSVQNSDNSLGTRTVYHFIWLDNIPVAQLRLQYNSAGNPLGSPQLTYIHADHLYTPRIATGYSAQTLSHETVVWNIWSNAYGYAFPNNDPDGDKLLTGGSTVDIALRFPGQVYYGVSVYNYNYYRDYDTVTGRYLESDPIGLWGGLNTYVYVDNNPLSWVDPLGLWPEFIDRAKRNRQKNTVDMHKEQHSKVHKDIFGKPNTQANKQIRDAARDAKIPKDKQREFRQWVEKEKNKEGRGGNDNYTWDELKVLAEEFKDNYCR